jgi:hypothetical protein
MLQNSLFPAFLDKVWGWRIQLCLEGACWYEELGRLVQSFSIVFFTTN